VAGHAYHVLNRGNGGATVFHKDGDYTAFLDLLATAKAKDPVKLFGVCLMPNHFHLVVQPATDGALSSFMQWWMTSYVRRYHRHYRSHGHVWQGRFKSFPIQQEMHLLTVLHYVLRIQSAPGGRARHGLALVEPALPASERPSAHRNPDRVAPVDRSAARQS
jgi:putative transposase